LLGRAVLWYGSEAVLRLTKCPGMMTKEEYRAALDKLSLTQEEVGELLSLSGRNARRYASGETDVPGAVEMHVRLWLERPEILDVVRRISAQIPKNQKGKKGKKV